MQLSIPVWAFLIVTVPIAVGFLTGLATERIFKSRIGIKTDLTALLLGFLVGLVLSYDPDSMGMLIGTIVATCCGLMGKGFYEEFFSKKPVATQRKERETEMKQTQVSQKIVLDALPKVSITVPLPKIGAGEILWPLATSWQNAEQEFVLGVLTTAAVRAGRWVPVSVTEFAEIVLESPWQFAASGMINAAWALATQGLLQVVTVNGRDYLVPTEEMAQVLKQADLRVIPTEFPQTTLEEQS